MGGTQAKFGRTSRATFIDEKKSNIKNLPGPGYYRAPSEFGQYDGNVYGASALSRFTHKQRWVYFNKIIDTYGWSWCNKIKCIINLATQLTYIDAEFHSILFINIRVLEKIKMTSPTQFPTMNQVKGNQLN